MKKEMKKLFMSLLMSATAFCSSADGVPDKIYVLGPNNADVNGMVSNWDPFNPSAVVDVLDGEATVVITCPSTMELTLYAATQAQIQEVIENGRLWDFTNEASICPSSLEEDMFGTMQPVVSRRNVSLAYGGKWTLKFSDGLSKATVNCAPDNYMANFGRYHADNMRLRAGAGDGTRVVFMGDSITDGWPLTHPDFFSDNNFIGRGISSQSSYEMLRRFRADVVRLKPAAVVILAGTNDIAGTFCKYDEERTIGNIRSMADIAAAQGIKVLLSSVLPMTNRYAWATADYKDKIENLNKLIKAYADEHGFTYVDYYSLMATSDRSFNAAYSNDGVHPSADGYEVMEGIVRPLILKAVEEFAGNDIPVVKTDSRLVSVDGDSVCALCPVKIYDASGKLTAVLAEGEDVVLPHGVYVASSETGSCKFSVGVR